MYGIILLIATRVQLHIDSHFSQKSYETCDLQINHTVPRMNMIKFIDEIVESIALSQIMLLVFGVIHYCSIF